MATSFLQLGFDRFDGRLLAGSVLFLSQLAVGANPFYEHRIVARTGDQGITNISESISINDGGLVAFVGSTATGAKIFIGSGLAPARNITPNSIRKLGPAVQINNRNQIVGDDSFIRASLPPIIDCFPFIGCVTLSPGSPGGSSSFIRVWDANGSDASQIVAQGDSSAILGNSDDAFVVLPFPSINNRGGVAYLSIRNKSGNRVTTPGGFAPLPGSAAYRVQIADDGKTVVRYGGESASPIRLFGVNPSQVQEVANAAMGFTEMGRSPGISDDGKVIAFVGNRGQGRGVFARLIEDSGLGPVIRIAGELEGRSAVLSDGGRDATGPLFFEDFDLDSRVGVVRLEAGRSGLEDDELVLCFLATPNRSKAALPNGDPIWTAKKGLWTMRCRLGRAIGQGAGSLSVRWRSARPVAQLGDTVEGMVIGDLKIHDPIALIAPPATPDPCPPTQPDHRVGFWAQSGNRQMVVHARVVPIVVYPIISQLDENWRSKRYAPNQVDGYLARAPIDHADKVKLETVKAKTVTLGTKGCNLSCYAMVLNTLLDRSDLTTDSLHERFQTRISRIDEHPITAQIDPNRVTLGISGVKSWRGDVPRFFDANLSGDDVCRDREFYGTAIRRIPLRIATDSERLSAAREIIAAHSLGNPVLLNVTGAGGARGGHWVISKGLAGCSESGEARFEIVDPGSRRSALRTKTLKELGAVGAVILKRQDQVDVTRALGPQSLLAPASTSDDTVVMQIQGSVQAMITWSDGERGSLDTTSLASLGGVSAQTVVPIFPILSPDEDSEEAGDPGDDEPSGAEILFNARSRGQTFSIQVTGKGNTEFSVYVSGGNPSQSIKPQVISGKLAGGESTTIVSLVGSEAPALRISRADENSVVISWPSSFSGFQLQAATNAANPLVWLDLKSTPALGADRIVVRQPIAGGATFFRLMKQP